MADYKLDLLIDKNNLDDECVKSASLFGEWATAEELANERVDDAKAYLELVKAEVELGVRGMGVADINTKYGLKLSGLTEGTVKSIIVVDPGVLEAQQLYYSAKAEAAKLKVATASFAKRHDSLSNLVKLHGQGFFSQVEGKDERTRRFMGLRADFAAKRRKEIDDDIPY